MSNRVWNLNVYFHTPEYSQWCVLDQASRCVPNGSWGDTPNFLLSYPPQSKFLLLHPILIQVKWLSFFQSSLVVQKNSRSMLLDLHPERGRIWWVSRCLSLRVFSPLSHSVARHRNDPRSSAHSCLLQTWLSLVWTFLRLPSSRIHLTFLLKYEWKREFIL